MNIDPGHPIDREPLTPEERELAQRLSRLGPSAGPPSSVDARILAAAHDAVASRPRPKARSHRRWPVALGVAASLVLAVGIAWRLRPLPEGPQYRTEGAADSAQTVAAPAAAGDPASESDTHFVTQEPRKPEPAPAAPAEVAQDAAKEAPRPEPAPPPAEPPITVDEARASDLQAPPPPAAPPAPVADMSAPANDAAAAAGAAPSVQERERMSKAAEAVSAQRAKSAAAPRKQSNDAPELRRASQSAENIAIVDIDDAGDEPPAYANSPEVREAWLRRVRELIVEGNQQQALDSLHEFQRRYPDHPLPDDLQRFKQSKTDPVVP